MADKAAQKELPEELLGLGAKDYKLLVPGAREYFAAAVNEYAERLLSQAKSIEESEHIGPGPAEITAAHVAEAKWVLIRRQRRQAQRRGWITFVRVIQTSMATLTGVGASYFSQRWGVILLLCSMFIGLISLVAERELDREF